MKLYYHKGVRTRWRSTKRHAYKSRFVNKKTAKYIYLLPIGEPPNQLINTSIWQKTMCFVYVRKWHSTQTKEAYIKYTPRPNRHSGNGQLAVNGFKNERNTNFAQISLDYFYTSSNCVSMLTLILRMSFN